MKFLQDLTYEKLSEMAAQAGLPAYRAAQLFGWAARGASYAQMSNVPQKVKEFFIVVHKFFFIKFAFLNLFY